MDDMEARANTSIEEAQFTENVQPSTSAYLPTRYEVNRGSITAQRVALPRDEAAIRKKIKIYAAMAGEDWYYRWPTKNKDGTKGWVEGPSIDCAESVAALVGNNQVDCDMRDGGTHWLFLARYVDLETGFTLTRPFQQRKAQNLGGKMDAERAQDIVFQIGASKATRNVITNAIRVFTNFAFEEAKQNLAETIGKSIEKYRNKIIGRLGDLSIPIPRVERVYAKKIADFLAPDLAKVIAEIKAIDEGMASRDECYPPTPEENAAQTIEAEQTVKQETKSDNTDWNAILNEISIGANQSKSIDELNSFLKENGIDFTTAPASIRSLWAKEYGMIVTKLSQSGKTEEKEEICEVVVPRKNGKHDWHQYHSDLVAHLGKLKTPNEFAAFEKINADQISRMEKNISAEIIRQMIRKGIYPA